MSPLLRWLDREKLAYDLTTDLALARGEGPALGNAPGVAFASSELGCPSALLRRLGATWSTAAAWRRSASTRSGARCA